MEVFARSAAVPSHSENPLSQVAALVQPHLDEVDNRLVEQALAFDPAVEGYVSHALGGRAKRLRPLVALLSGGASGSIKPEHVDLAVIVELIHVATLVHDDIMDEAQLRRGRPTLNARWGNALSVLLGDSLFAHALQLSTEFEDASISRAIAGAARDVCSGEIIQTQRGFDLQLTTEDYLRIIQKKTGSLFRVAAELAAKINSVNRETAAAFQNAGYSFGIAYQIYDDCIDLAGSEEFTGKTLGTDLKEGKLTLPVLILLDTASPIEKARLSSLILEGRTEEIASGLRQAGGADAFNHAVSIGQDFLRQASAALETVSDGKYAIALCNLMEVLHGMLERLRP